MPAGLGPEEKREPGALATDLIVGGSSFLGSTAGIGVSLVAGPVAGAAASTAVTRVLQRVGDDFANRYLGRRQAARVGGALGIAVEDIQRRIDAGDVLRTDGLFADVDGEGSDVVEAVLSSAARSSDRKKVLFEGHLISGIAFDSSVSGDEAHYLNSLLERLTYRQLVLIALIGAPGASERFAQLEHDLMNTPGLDVASSLAAELEDLASSGLIGVYQQDGRVVRVDATTGGASYPSFGRMRPAPAAERLRILARLDLASEADQQVVWEQLGAIDPHGGE